MNAFDKAQQRLGIRLPDSARTFYGKPPVLENLYPATLKNLTELTYLFPACPARYLPLFSISNGDLLGVYFPRGGEPVVAGFDHEQSNLVPVSRDVAALFKNPDVFCFNDPTEPMRCFWRKEEAWASLRVRPDAELPELELFKPFAVQYEPLHGLNPKVFRPLLRRFGSDESRARLVGETFTDIKSLHDRQRWIRLSNELALRGFRIEAIQALENCHTLHFIYPSYGEPDAKDPGPSWGRVLDVLERLHPLVERDGDPLDRITTERCLRVAREWARRY